MPGDTAGSNSPGTSPRVPGTLSGALHPSATLYDAATPPGVASRSREAANLQRQGNDAGCQRREMVIGAPSCGHRPSATFGGRLHGVLPESEIRRGARTVSVTCLVRHPVAKLHEAIRVTPEFKIDQDLMVYARLASGFTVGRLSVKPPRGARSAGACARRRRHVR